MDNTERRNLILVTIDSLRADFCGYIDGGPDATPTLTEMGRDGVGFECAFAPGPSTPESMPAIFTGHYPCDPERGGTEPLTERRDRIRRHMVSRDSLPERLSRLGYTTAAFTPNPFTSRHFGFDRGFDHFQDFMGENREKGGLYERVFEGFLSESRTSSLARVFLNFWQREEVFKPWESYYDEVVEWAHSVDEPYFIWVFLMDAHNPYLADPKYRSQSRLEQFHANFRFWRESHETPFSPSVHDRLVTAYEDAVRYADGFLKRLRTELANDDPVLVVHGDHGEAFGEHGTYGHEPYLYPENVHVPLVIEGCGSGTVSDPVTLRTLPDLVTAAGTGVLQEVGYSPYAIARTAVRDAIAVYTAETTYISDGTNTSTLPDEANETFEDIIATFKAFQREKRLFTEIAGEATDL